MKVAILSGSSRRGNNTIRVSRAIKECLIQDGLVADDVRICDFVNYDIPFFNGEDLDRSNPTEFQSELYTAMSEAQVIFILSPEYNWFPSAEVINLIHRFATSTNKDLFGDKIFATAGISAGKGGKVPAVQLSYVLNKVVNFLDLQSIVSARIFESMHTPAYLDEDGKFIGEESYEIALKEFIRYSVTLAKRWSVNS
jgi:chromate reductase